MIVIPIQLYSAISGEISNLGTIVIDNIGGTKDRGDYRARAYQKGAADEGVIKMVRTSRPFREAQILGHRRRAEPVGNLVSKSLKALGYA